MLAALRRRRAQPRWRPAQAHRLADEIEPTTRRVLDRLDDAEMIDLGIGEDLVDRVDRPTGHAGAIEDIDPFAARALRRVVLERGIERVAVGGAGLLIGVARIGLELGCAESPA